MIEHPNLHQVVDVGALSTDEAQLLAAFRATADAYRANVLIVVQALARRFPLERPALTLVQSGSRTREARYGQS